MHDSCWHRYEWEHRTLGMGGCAQAPSGIRAHSPSRWPRPPDSRVRTRATLAADSARVLENVSDFLLDAACVRFERLEARHHDIGARVIALLHRVSHDATNGLSERELCPGRWQVDHHAETRDIDTLGDHSDRDEPLGVAVAERRNASLCTRRLVVHDDRSLTLELRDELGEELRHLDRGRDNEAAGAWHPQPQLVKLDDCGLEHAGVIAIEARLIVRTRLELWRACEPIEIEGVLQRRDPLELRWERGRTCP